MVVWWDIGACLLGTTIIFHSMDRVDRHTIGYGQGKPDISIMCCVVECGKPDISEVLCVVIQYCRTTPANLQQHLH